MYTQPFTEFYHLVCSDRSSISTLIDKIKEIHGLIKAVVNMAEGIKVSLYN